MFILLQRWCCSVGNEYGLGHHLQIVQVGKGRISVRKSLPAFSPFSGWKIQRVLLNRIVLLSLNIPKWVKSKALAWVLCSHDKRHQCLLCFLLLPPRTPSPEQHVPRQSGEGTGEIIQQKVSSPHSTWLVYLNSDDPSMRQNTISNSTRVAIFSKLTHTHTHLHTWCQVKVKFQ